MRYVSPASSKHSGNLPSSPQSPRNHARDSRREGLARIPEEKIADASAGVLAAVASSRRLLRAQTTILDPSSQRHSQPQVISRPKRAGKKSNPSTSTLMDPSIPFEMTSFTEWYNTLSLEKRRTLMVSMMEVCKERDAKNGGAPMTIDPDKIAFQWNVEDEKDCFILQFSRWYTSLEDVEQNTALAYSGIEDGDKIADLPTEAEVQEDEDKENRQVARPFVKEPSFIEGSSSRATARDAETDPKSVAAKGKTKRLTREASVELHSWAHSYVQQHRPISVPKIPVEPPVDRDTYWGVGFAKVALPTPPKGKRGTHRAKLTCHGTVFLDSKGQPIWERIPPQYL